MTGEPLVKRRDLLENHILPKLAEPVRCSPVLEASLCGFDSVHKGAGP